MQSNMGLTGLTFKHRITVCRQSWFDISKKIKKNQCALYVAANVANFCHLSDHRLLFLMACRNTGSPSLVRWKPWHSLEIPATATRGTGRKPPPSRRGWWDCCCFWWCLCFLQHPLSYTTEDWNTSTCWPAILDRTLLTKRRQQHDN